MKTKHEKLNEICKKIGYEIKAPEYDIQRAFGVDENYLDVREIIFTTEFTSLLRDFLDKETMHISQETFVDFCMNHLDNPVDYLYKLIK